MVALYALSLKGVSGNPVPGDIKNKLDQATKPLELSPERGRFALTMSLVENKSFALTQTLADAVYPDVGYYQGRFYIFFAPGISLMAAPLYMLGKYFGLSQVASFSLSVFFAILNAIFIYLISRKIFNLPTWASLFNSLVFSFGSTSWSYAVSLYQHQATTFFIISAFYSVWMFKQKTKFSWIFGFWVWAAAGLAVSVDYPNVLFMIPVMIYFLFSALDLKTFKNKVQLIVRPALIFTSIAFIFLIGIHGYYNYTQFGGPTKLSGSLVGIKTVYKNKNLDTAEKKAIFDQEASNKNVTNFFTEERVPMSFTILTVSPDRGLFLYSPIFVIAILGLIFALKNQRNWETSTLLASILTIIFLYSSWDDPWGGWAFGPRYLIPALGMLSIFIGYFLNRFKNIFIRIATFLLFAYSSAVSLIGVLTTNAVPPRVEAVALHTGYNFLYNWKFFSENHSSSFIFNTYFKSHFSLMQYSIPIYALLIIFAFIFLFIMPMFTRKHES